MSRNMQRALSYDEFLNEQIMNTSYGKNDYLHFTIIASEGKLDEVKKLVEEGMNPNGKEENVPLTSASYWGKYEVVQYLLSLPEVNINITNPRLGNTALHQAVRGHRPEILKLLLENGIDYNIKNLNEDTALTLCEKHKSSKKEEMLEILKNAHIYKLKSKVTPTMNKVQKNSGIF